uniref:RRM domain-containing protein n=1 Tax=Brassica campestris TaxID=3711 RepID=M4CFJ4_BRACM
MAIASRISRSKGLSKRTTSEGLRTAFAQFGEVADAKVVTDRVSGYSKGFGFVRYTTLEDSAKGIAGMDGKFLDGWVIFAEYARPREPYRPQNNMPPPPPYGNRY